MLPLGRVWAPLPAIPFPSFFMGAQNTTWFTQMLPVFEQQALYNAYNFSTGTEGLLGADGMPVGVPINSTVYGTKLYAFQCPSDNERDFSTIWPTNGYLIRGTRGNYVVSWGNTQWGQQDTAGGTPTLNMPVTYRRSAFGHKPTRLVERHGRHEQHGLHGGDASGPDQRRPRRDLDAGGRVHEPVHPERDARLLRRRPTRQVEGATGWAMASA